MNKYFWVWLASCILYALGISTIVMTGNQSILTTAYIGNECFQIGALLCIYYACNFIDNIPHNFFGLKYGALLLIFSAVYVVIYRMDQTFYIVMLIFKLIVVLMSIYTIIVKWRFEAIIKFTSITFLGISGIYLSLYNFIIYGDTNDRNETMIYVCIGILFLVFQNFDLAVLYRIQVRNQEKLRGDYLTIFAENSADVIFYYTLLPYPRFSFVSPASRTLLGYSPQAFYGNSKLHIEMTVEEDRPKMIEAFNECQGDRHKHVIRAERRDGEIVNLECYITKVKVNGKVVAVEGVLRDITERVVSERKVVENNRNRQLMLSYISHDLKTPITYILGYSEAIKKNIIKSEEDKNRAIESIYVKANSLAKLVEDISLLSKLEASRFNYEFEKIKCSDLALHLKEQHNNDFHDTNGEYGFITRDYQFEISDSITDNDQVLVDIKRMEQVFENLLSNAIKVTENGGKIHIVCYLSRKKSQFYISVNDDGHGISEEDMPHIFENFYQSPETKKRLNGSGLGLSLSKQIILGHGGKIIVESKTGIGSKFIVSIPLFET